ncbi:MAG: ABC-type glycerol-3-phosphate transport system permease component [Crocinitomix sp.]|jgi:ABC-type glycerol-3-phosphate transport system permease component
MTTKGSKIKGWIKLEDYKKINFPDDCPFTGLKVNAYREYTVEDSSFLWRILGLLRWAQYITIQIPFHENGISQLKKIRNKAILKGLLIGFLIAVLTIILVAIISSITFYAYGRAELKTVGFFLTVIGGSIAGFSLFLGPLLMYYRAYNRSYPLYFKKKGGNIWVKVRNSDYRKKFIAINELNIIEDTAGNDAILDD